MIRFNLFILSLFFVGGLHAQNITIHGAIIDKENLENLMGVHVFTSLSNGTTSDIDGNFYLKVHPLDTLHLSMLGYKSQLIIISDSSKTQDMIIQMEPGAIMLEGVGIIDYFQANTIIKLPERKVYKVPGIKYPDPPDRNKYQYLGAAFNPYYAAFTMSRKDYKQHKKLYKEFPNKLKQKENLADAKEKMHEALGAIGDHLDDYYMVDFIRFVGMTVEGVVSRSAYDLAKMLPGQVDRYLEELKERKSED